MRVAWFLLSLVACGRIDFDLRNDAGARSDTTADAFFLECGPWSGDLLIPELQSPAYDWDPAFSPDGNLLIFSSDRGSQFAYELYIATRMGGIAFGTPQNIAVINASTSNTSPTWLPTGDGIYFVSNRGAVTRLWYSSYSAVSGFGTPVMVPELSSTYVSAPTVSHDGLEMLFVDDTAGVGSEEIKRATRPTMTSPWTVVGSVPELQVNGSAGWPTFAIDDLHIIFETAGMGARRLYASQRASRTTPFDPPVEITEILDANALNYTDPDLSPDGTILIHGREDIGTSTSFDLWVTTRTCN